MDANEHEWSFICRGYSGAILDGITSDIAANLCVPLVAVFPVNPAIGRPRVHKRTRTH